MPNRGLGLWREGGGEGGLPGGGGRGKYSPDLSNTGLIKERKMPDRPDKERKMSDRPDKRKENACYSDRPDKRKENA